MGKALHGQPVGLGPTEGILEVCYCRNKVERINLRKYPETRRECP